MLLGSHIVEHLLIRPPSGYEVDPLEDIGLIKDFLLELVNVLLLDLFE